MADTTRRATPHRRHPRLVRGAEWLRMHQVGVGLLAAALIAAVFVLDLATPQRFLAGLYFIPLTLLAISLREHVVGFAVVVCLILDALANSLTGELDVTRGLELVYGALAGGGLVILAYLIARLTDLSGYASARAQLAEATADIVSGVRGRGQIDELLQESLERMGSQVWATHGVLLTLGDGGELLRRAAFGLDEVTSPRAVLLSELPAAQDALEAGHAVQRDGAAGVFPVPPHTRLEVVLTVPVRTFGKDVGIIVLDRPYDAGEYREEELGFVESVARYVGVALENLRLMVAAESRRRALELVRDSSLDFAQSVGLPEVLEAVVMRLLHALGMDACDVYEVDLEREELRLLVNYGDWQLDEDVETGSIFTFAEFGASALAVTTRQPVMITSPDDPILTQRGRELFRRYDHRTGVSIPLRIGERVIGLVELYDNKVSRKLDPDELSLAGSICRFAALAMDKARLFEEERATAERLDRLARQLQRLQEFSLGLTRRLAHAPPQTILDEVVRAARDLLGVQCVAALGGGGEQLIVKAMAGRPKAALVRSGAGSGLPTDEEPTAAAVVLDRCHAVLVQPPDGLLAEEGMLAPRTILADGLLAAPVEGDKPSHVTALVMLDKLDGAFDDADELLAATLAAQLGASLHNAAAFQREHEIAETFQQALLMQPPPIPGMDVGVCYRAATEAARVGGDFYDVVRLGPNRLMVVVGDVCGKSLPAAAQSAVVRYMLRAYAQEESPGQALSRLNATVLSQMPGEPFVTLVVAYIDVARHMLEYAVAGHPRPIVLAGHGAFPLSDDGGVPIGIFSGAVYATQRAILPEDSTVVLYTDGMIEARRERKLFGERRLAEAVMDGLALTAQDQADSLLATVRDYAEGVLADDCAVVVIRLP